MGQTYRTEQGKIISWNNGNLNNNVQVIQQWVNLININVSNVSTRSEGKLTVEEALRLIKNMTLELTKNSFWYQASETLNIFRQPNGYWVTVHAFIPGSSGITMDISEQEFRELLVAVQELTDKLM